MKLYIHDVNGIIFAVPGFKILEHQLVIQGGRDISVLRHLKEELAWATDKWFWFF